MVAQPRYNLVDREIEGDYSEITRSYGIAVCPWNPLGQGFLTGKYTREDGLTGESRAAKSSRFKESYLIEENFNVHDELDTVAGEVDATPARTALAWFMHRDGVTVPIVGARTVEWLAESLEATAIDLTDERVDRLTKTKPDLYVGL